ncbi:double-strand break repair protein AddB [Aquisediminimonas profunda]|uniref:double-strand break repair protein AddB n=1 Tax=Aquisediminimonas profunda TaxID=1550733 RepID=UPI001C62E930|nr:double-strand break repair protein AddB [Aquisediminimonas profunda]
MADRFGPAVFTIPPIRAFADALVAGVLAQHGSDKMVLARGMILVPNNRAGQAIREAFVRQAEHGLLLPRLVAVGDSELEEQAGAVFDLIDDAPIPPAIEPLQRQLILARMIQKDRGVDGAEAMRLAVDLARTLDQLIVEDVSPSRLAELNLSGELSTHWNASLEQMRAILELWPMELERRGRIDLADRRNRQLRRVAEVWRAQSPTGFVIAAGVSTGAPAVAELLAQVARMPGGQVVLAGLDLTISELEWSKIGGGEGDPAIETHPQFHLYQLLSRMKIGRGEVQRWKWSGDVTSTSKRARAISHAFAPAEMTQSWVGLDKADRNLAGVSALELANPAEEAQAIALAIRGAIEEPGRTVALITPDRALASRVSAHLARWQIQADDSAGQSLASLPNGTLLLLLTEAAADHFSPSALLALLKHPLVMQGDPRRTWLDQVRKLDLVLRGPRPAPGLNGVARFLSAGDKRTERRRGELQSWWAETSAILAPLEHLAGKDLPAMLAILREVAGTLAGDSLWSGQAGRELAGMIGNLERDAADGPTGISLSVLPQLLRQLIGGVAMRPGYGGHPRVFIWGLLEAKLQSADFVILGGLNEGSWPQLPAPDPWLAPRIRRDLGLPSLERRIGLSAHDLASALGAPRVLLTRAKRDARSPTIASRFWLRLATMAGGLDPPDLDFRQLAQGIDTNSGKAARAKRPAPCPPAVDRPRSISVTAVDRLSADPFAFYASAILGLNRLEPVDADPGPAWRGSLIHDVLERWAKDDAYKEGALVARMNAALSGGTLHPLIRALWLPRLSEAAEWIERSVAENKAQGRTPLVAEVSGETEFAGVKIRGRADRIDRLTDGRLAIVDYKTGEGPNNKQIAAGFAMQLGLVGLIAEQGGFEGAHGQSGAFEYWSLARHGKSRQFGKITSPVAGNNAVSEPEKFVDLIAAQFREAAANWLTGIEPYKAKIRPEYAWADYDQLMRLEEWQGRDV